MQAFWRVGKSKRGSERLLFIWIADGGATTSTSRTQIIFSCFFRVYPALRYPSSSLLSSSSQRVVKIPLAQLNQAMTRLQHHFEAPSGGTEQSSSLYDSNNFCFIFSAFPPPPSRKSIIFSSRDFFLSSSLRAHPEQWNSQLNFNRVRPPAAARLAESMFSSDYNYTHSTAFSGTHKMLHVYAIIDS